jgi:hypothetical protein
METQSQQPTAYDAVNTADTSRLNNEKQLTRAMKGGANTFYWIAALSVINSLLTIFGAGRYFVIGLGSTLFVDAVAKTVSDQLGGSILVLIVGFVISLIINLIVAAFGAFAGDGKKWAFIVGMALYGVDALIMLAFTELLGFAFHLYFLWAIWRGLSALGKLQAARAADPMAVSSAETMR